MSRTSSYEEFHKAAQVQKKIVGRENFTYTLILRQLCDLIEDGHGLKILDFGCGVGTVSMYLSSKGHTVIGVDVSKKAIGKAKESAAFNRLLNTNFMTLDEWERKKTSLKEFDLIICFEVLEHVKNDIKTLRSLKKVLKHKGLILVSVPSLNAPLYKLGLVKKFDLNAGHLRRYNKSSLENTLSSAGFSIIWLKKTEGIIRNALFTIKPLDKLIKLIRGPLTKTVTFIDEVSIKMFGESDLFMLAQKP